MDLTVKELHEDLQAYRSNLEFNISQYEAQRAEYWAKINKGLHESQEYSIVLYTQQENHLFALSQACQNLEDLMEDFQKNQHPFEKWKSSFDSEIERYSRLEDLLGHIDTRALTTKGEEARLQCVEICAEIKERLSELQQQIYTNDELYEAAASRMSETTEYNANRFETLRHNIFMTGGDSYLKILGSLRSRVQQALSDVKGNGSGTVNKTTRRENVSIMLLLLTLAAFSLAAAWLLSGRFLAARIGRDGVLKNKRFVTAAIALSLFLLLAFFTTRTFMSGYNILPSVDLFLYNLIIIDVFVVSIALGFEAEKNVRIFSCYLPILVAAMVFIMERLLLVSNNIINLTVPALLLVFFIWQLLALLRYGHFSERFSAISLWLGCIITAVLCLMSWFGYTFLALMFMIYWIVQLTCFQAVACLNWIVRRNEKKHKGLNRARNLWLTPTIEKLVLPLITVAAVAFSFKWAAQMFSMRSWADGILGANLAGADSKVHITLSGILVAVALAFAIMWLIDMVKTALKEIYKENYTTGAIPLYVTLGSMLIWLIYLSICLKMFNINSKALIAAVGGMGVGLGFALKDTINDVFCGLSLLMGRVHLNDYIECDGIRGRIVEVGMRTTTVDTMDGSTIAFLNSQLFAKNFKNITKSHSWELCKVQVGVSYGTDVEKARRVILDALAAMDKGVFNKEPVVQVADFGDSSVDLVIKVWIKTKDRLSVLPDIRERVYKAFKENGVEIPFPQRDIHIIQTKPDEPVSQSGSE